MPIHWSPQSMSVEPFMWVYGSMSEERARAKRRENSSQIVLELWGIGTGDKLSVVLGQIHKINKEWFKPNHPRTIHKCTNLICG